MPTHKVKGGYKWGKSGKVYPTKAQADKQGQAIYASGWKENKTNENKQSNMTKKQIIKLTENDLHRIIKESINRILNEYDESRKKFDNTSMRTRHGNNNIHDYKGKAAMNALGMNGTENKEIAMNDNGVGEYDRYDVNEAFSDYYNVSHFSDPNKDYYNSFVIVDGTRAVVGQYDNYEEAVADAKEMAMKNKYGAYEVYGCDKNGYALKEDYPEDNTLVYSTDEDFV